MRDELLRVGTIRRLLGTRQILNPERVAKFLSGIKNAIAWFALTSLTGFWPLKALSFFYASLVVFQLVECTSRGLLKDYPLKRKFAIASVLLAPELLPATPPPVKTIKAIIQLLVCWFVFKPPTNPHEYQNLPGDSDN